MRSEIPQVVDPKDGWVPINQKRRADGPGHELKFQREMRHRVYDHGDMARLTTTTG